MYFKLHWCVKAATIIGLSEYNRVYSMIAGNLRYIIVHTNEAKYNRFDCAQFKLEIHKLIGKTIRLNKHHKYIDALKKICVAIELN